MKKTAMLALLCCFLLAPLCLSAAVMESNTDRPGADYYDFDMSKPGAKFCRDVCMIDMKCKAWTYAHPNCPVNTGPNPHCWLKDDVPKGVSNKCCTSGIKKPVGSPKAD